MLVGSTLDDVLAVSSVSKQDVAEMEKAASVKEPLCKQKIHRKVLDKGVPEDVMPGIKNIKVKRCTIRLLPFIDIMLRTVSGRIASSSTVGNVEQTRR